MGKIIIICLLKQLSNSFKNLNMEFEESIYNLIPKEAYVPPKA